MQNVNVAIISWGDRGKCLYKLLREKSKYNVKCIIEENSRLWNTNGEVPIVSSGKGSCLFEENEIDYFLMPSLDEHINQRIINMLQAYGIEKKYVLYAPIDVFCDGALSDEEKVGKIVPYLDNKELEAMELHAAEHCNLNCKYCSMFCGLVSEPEFPVFSDFEQGLHKLKKYFSHIKIFRIIGGEPLLNPDLQDYIKLIRKVYPYTDIRLITNGILVTKMDEELINVIRENNVTFIVTQYVALRKMIDEIKQFLEIQKIRYIVTEVVVEFSKIYNARGNSSQEEIFAHCSWRNSCAAIYGTKIAACYVPFVIHHLSDHFHLDIQESGIIDLCEDNLSTFEIRKRMNTCLDLCKYCAPKGNYAKWERMDVESYKRLEDWSI